MFMICLWIFGVGPGEEGEGMDETKLDMSWWLLTLTDVYTGVPHTIFSDFLCVIFNNNKRKKENVGVVNREASFTFSF